MAAQVAPDEINAFVRTVLADENKTQEQKAAEISSAATKAGVTTEQIAAATGYSVEDVSTYMASVPAYMQENPDVAAAYAANNYGMTPQEFAQAHYDRYGAAEQRAATGVTPSGTQSASVTTMPASVTPTTTAATTATTGGAGNSSISAADAAKLVTELYGSIGRTGVGSNPNQIDQAGLDYWANQLTSGALNKDNIGQAFSNAVNVYLAQKPDDAISKYVTSVNPLLDGRDGTMLMNANAAGLSLDAYKAAINDYVQATLADKSLTPSQQIAKIVAAAAERNVPVYDIARSTGISISQVQAAFDSVPKYFLDNPDVAAEYAKNSYGLSAEDFANTHYNQFGKNEGRAAPGTTAANTFTSAAGYQTGSKKLGSGLDGYLAQLKTAFSDAEAGKSGADAMYSKLYGELTSKGLSDAEIAAVFSAAINKEMPLQNVVNFGQKYTIGELGKKVTSQNDTISGLSGQIGDLQGVIEKLKTGSTVNANGQVTTTNASTSDNNDKSDASVIGNYLYTGNYQGGMPTAGVNYLTDGSSSNTGVSADSVRGWGLSGIGLGNYGARTRRAADGSNRDVYFAPKKYNRSSERAINGAGWGASYMPF